MIQTHVLSSVKTLRGDEGEDEGLVSMEEIAIHRQRISTNTWALLLFILYLIIGLLFYCYVDEISPLDSVYLSVITLTTIGYGE